MIIYSVVFFVAMMNNMYSKYCFGASLDAILKDCINLTSTLCGVCGRTSLELQEKCIYPFSYRFTVEDKSNGACNSNDAGGSCREVTSHCKGDSCLNGGTCHEGFGTFRCLCTNTHYGMRCEHKRENNNKKYAAGIQVFLSQHVKFNTNATLIISTDMDGSNLLIKMESDFFHLNYVDTPDRKFKNYTPDMRQKYCQDLTGLSETGCRFIRNATNDVYTMMYNFPVINSTTGPFIFKGDHFPFDSSEHRVGYIATLTITAYQTKRPTHERLTYIERDNLSVFDKSYKLLVYYNNQTYCIAVISQRQQEECSISPRKRPVFPPRERIRVVFCYNTFENNCSQGSGQWNVKDELIIRSVYPHYFESSSEVIKYTWRPRATSIIQESYTFETGIISFEYYGHSGLTPASFSRCFLEIKRELLIPEINDGINQTYYANTEDGLIIDARRSTNLNRRDKLRLMKWTCKLGSTSIPCFTQYLYNDTADFFKFPANFLEIGKVYNFSLKLFEPTYELTKSNAYIAVEVGTNRTIIRLSCPECWGGILAKPKDYNILVLKHIGIPVKPGEYRYQWRYREVGEHSYKSANDIRIKDTDENIFKIEKLALKHSKSYEFNASVVENPYSYATLIIKIPDKHMQNCSIEPTDGIKGVTLFNIICVVLPADGVTYVYEFFDKDSRDGRLYSGRMLGASVSGDLYKFRLTRGEVAIISYDSHKVTEEINLFVSLKEFNGTSENIDSLMDILKTDATYGRIGIHHLQNSQPHLALTAVIAEILTVDMKRNYLIRDLVNYIFRSEMYYISDVKLFLSSIRNILEVMFQKFHGLVLDADVANHCADVILRITTDLVNRVNHIEIEKTLTEVVCDEMAQFVLDSIAIVVSYKNQEVLYNIEEFVNPVILEMVQQTSNVLVKSLGQISHMLLRLRTPGDSPLVLKSFTSVKEQITAWMKVSHPEDLHHITASKEHFPLLISKDLAGTMRENSYLGVKFIMMDVNPFWWAGGNIVTQVLFVVLCDKNPNTMDCKKMHSLSYPVRLYFNITKSVQSIKRIEGDTIWLIDSMSDAKKDLTLSVYRFDPPARSKLFIKFLIENEEYFVLFKKNLRPDSNDMALEAILINNANPFYNITYENNDSDNIYYMGITPVIRSDDYDGMSNMFFHLIIYYTKCNVWLNWQWTDRGCWVGIGTNDTTLECECSHLSLFAGTVMTPVHDKFKLWDFKLFLTPQVNYLPFIILLLVILIYVILFIMSVLWDRKDKKKCNIIVLQDNYPGDKYGYLIAVYTGSRIRSSTDANVGIRLLGSQADSRSHILKCSARKTLRTNSDDWFLIFCPVHLGNLTCLHLWHDNTTFNPGWFLEKITVFDLKEELAYMFYIYQWIAFNLEMIPEVLVAPIGLKDCLKKNRTLADNLAVGFRDSHYWTSIWWRHPRDPLTRVYRLQVVFCFIMIAMAVSLLLYLARYKFTNFGDEPSYKLTSFDYWVLLLSFFSALLISCFTMSLLTHSFSLKYKRNRSSLVMQTGFSQSVEKFMKNKKLSGENSGLAFSNSQHNGRFLELEDEKKHKKTGSFYRLKFRIYKALSRSPLIPIQLKNASSAILVHKLCLICLFMMFTICTLLCCCVVLVFGWAIETVHGYQWLTIFILTLVIDIFVFSVLKLIMTSVLISLLFKRMLPIDTFRLDPNEAISKKLMGDPDHLGDLLDSRSKDMYIPLTHAMKDIYISKFHRWVRLQMIFEFVVVALFLIVIAMVTTTFTTVVYSSNRHADYMMSHGHFASSHPDFQDIFNRTDVEAYLNHNFIRQLYRFLWYNLEPLVESGLPPHRLDWTYDCVSRLVGNAYLRQLRVVSGLCRKIGHMENVSSSCSPAWSKRREDRETYYIGWSSHDDKNFLMSTTAWKYRPPDGFSSSRYYGASGTLYPAGGYFCHLGYKKRQTQYVISKLIQDSWLDHSTRALFVELTLYNVNTNLFSHVALIAEQMPTGEFLPRVKVDSIAIDLSFNLWNIGFTMFLVLFTIRAFFIVNQFGLSTILSKNIHRFEVFILCLGYSSIVMYVFHINTSSVYVENYFGRGMNEFFSFIKISKYAFIFRNMTSLLFVFLVLLMIYFFRLGKIYLKFFNTFYLSRYYLLMLTICLLISLVVLWQLIGSLIRIYLFRSYSSIIIHAKSFNILNKFSEIPLACRILLGFMYILSAIVMMAFIMYFVHFYKTAQDYKIVEVDNFHLFEFLWNEIKQLIETLEKIRKSFQDG